MTKTLVLKSKDDRLVGLRVKTLRKFYQLPTGSMGTITEVYKIGHHHGVQVEWDCGLKDGFGQDETEFLQIL